MHDRGLRERLDAAVELLDDEQRQRLLDWAGSMSRAIAGARSPGSSIGPIAEMMRISRLPDAPDGRRAAVRYALDVAPELLNPHGVLHGGAVYTMIDYSMGAATMAALEDGEICATIEIKVSYLAGVKRGALVCDTAIIKQGRNVVFLESRVVDDRSALVATASGSFAVMRR
ncbi:MAG: PaaI family thioesterase [Dehalococcoidia bacterium]|nr:PaaI family thioesterase [Dehalococcoidia bacterium]